MNTRISSLPENINPYEPVDLSRLSEAYISRVVRGMDRSTFIGRDETGRPITYEGMVIEALIAQNAGRRAAEESAEAA